MNSVFADSIAKAKSYYEEVTDLIHDLSHIERVTENAVEIAKAVGYKDLDFIKLCGFWHDAARAQGIEPHEEAGAVMARKDLLARGVERELANRAYEAIRFHKSTAKPVTVEGKIIRDADKLDIFSVTRWQRCAQAGWNDYYAEEFQKTLENLPKYPGVFTYDYSKKLYKKCLLGFLKLTKQPPFDSVPKD